MPLDFTNCLDKTNDSTGQNIEQLELQFIKLGDFLTVLKAKTLILLDVIFWVDISYFTFTLLISVIFFFCCKIIRQAYKIYRKFQPHLFI